ncbi:cobalamin biosynthesis protein [Nocardiopsis alkaliphila]|uniref:cobalamin biosynthesis protein n=1 Tax=Nocardiopsis alkaliphila TaxID=225762 RepID=UPI00034B5203|nr:cobalamin biosynthesis protein [Nocardiopsis alkaliphila]
MRRPCPESRAAGLLLGYAADRLLGDPRRFHPVAGFGTVASVLEERLYADSRPHGVVHAALLVGGCAGLGIALERATAPHPLLRTTVTALVTWTVLGGRSLEREASAVRERLSAGDLPGARERLRSLVGRDTSTLDAAQVARAVIESVAENSSDAVVAPLVWGALAGTPGLLAHRAANTLDAMVGHRDPRYRRFGWASARLDDLLNLPGARLAGALAALTSPGRTKTALRAWRRDARGHPSPNAGVVEASFAGALGIGLGGSNRYGARTEHRPAMGQGRSPEPSDIPRATALARRVGLGAVLVAAATTVLGTVVVRPGRR